MARVSNLPFEQIPEDLQKIMVEYDAEVGGSEFVEVFAHAPEVFKRFVDFYFGLEFESRGGIGMKLTELCRLKVAQHNDCFL